MAHVFSIERACDEHASAIRRMAALWWYGVQKNAGADAHSICDALAITHERELQALSQTISMAHSIAVKARLNAHAPYSKFLVGCAIIDEAGSIHAGCNVENVSYGLTQCAERAAVTAAVSSGTVALVVAVLVADTEEPITPCGACRQVLAEFGRDIIVISHTLTNKRAVYVVDELLPAAFTKW
jgi:cytidine deaminase